MAQGPVLQSAPALQTTEPVTYGTLFLGANTVSEAFGSMKYIFRVENRVRIDPEHSPPDAPQLFSKYERVKWKNVTTVDLLVVRQPREWNLRSLWMDQWCRQRQVKTLVLIHHENEILGSDSRSLHSVCKELKALGYLTHTLSACAEKCGAATWNSCTITIASLRTSASEDFFSSLPLELECDLPVRACRNIIRDYNIPYRNYRRNFDALVPQHHPVFPNFLGTYQDKPVFDTTGPFCGKDARAMVKVEGRGFRFLEPDEWITLKGVHKADTVTIATIVSTVESNIFSSLGLLLHPLLVPVAPSLIPSALPSISHPTPSPPDAPNVEPCDKPCAEPGKAASESLDWSPPDLSVDSDFYNETVRHLHVAVASLPSKEQQSAFLEGLNALSCHRRNYDGKNIHRLVVLWWEWPERHWDSLRLGTSMNFLRSPKPGFIPNQEMDAIQLGLAVDFVEDLIRLGVVKRASDHGIVVLNNFPLFLVPKLGQPGQYRCIADGKRGGQNDCCVPDPCIMTSPDHIIPSLYRNGWSVVLDMSKYFHTFVNCHDELPYLGLLYPGTNEPFVYDRLAMGTCNSPGGSGRLGTAFIRHVLETSPIFQGIPIDNSKIGLILGIPFDPSWGEGRILIGDDGLPAALVWIHVDDILIHAPTKSKVEAAMRVIMDEMVRFGLICQHVKTKPPAQVVKFCGFIYDTTAIPTLRIPADKISRAVALIHFLQRGVSGRLARLTLSKVLGFLQSLVPATPSNIGASFLHNLNKDLHSLKDTTLQGTKQYYFTPVQLSALSQIELAWWKTALTHDLLSSYRQMPDMGSLGVTWGDGSGTGTGGTFNFIDADTPNSVQEMETWLGVWDVRVHHHSSNWKELRTLLLTLQRAYKMRKNLDGRVLWYLTDNQVTYDICRTSTSSSPTLLSLLHDIRLLEMRLGCRLEVIHVPGKLMITQGTDGLSRGAVLQPLSAYNGVLPLEQIFSPADASLEVLHWALKLAGVSSQVKNAEWQFRQDLDDWSRCDLLDSNTCWVVSPHFGRQCMLQAMYAWTESPWNSSHLFILPRVMQRDFGRISKFIAKVGESWLIPLLFTPVVPFIVYYLPPFNRISSFLSKSDKLEYRLDAAAPTYTPVWIKKQVEALQRM